MLTGRNQFFSFRIHGIGEPKFRVLSQFMRSYAYQGDVASKQINNLKLFLYNWSQVKSNLCFYWLNVAQWAVTLFKTKFKTYPSKKAFDFKLLLFIWNLNNADTWLKLINQSKLVISCSWRKAREKTRKEELRLAFCFGYAPDWMKHKGVFFLSQSSCVGK